MMADVKELNINNTNYDIKAKSVVNENTGKLKFWSGTKEQYEAIETKDDDTLYSITDDTDITLEILSLIYPVGSIYITTASTCPLASLFGTWQLVAGDRVIQGAGTRGSAGTTVDESLPNITGTMIPWAYQGGGETGAFTSSGTTYDSYNVQGTTTGKQIQFNASNSSSTYQDNAPVQQDAYIVNIYERTN